MNYYKQALLITAAMVLFVFSFGQSLKIGDKVPDIEFTKVYNYTSPSLKFSDFKGKWILLDFWSTRCASCIKNFPKMDSLQKVFKDKIQIILVSEQRFDTAISFFQKLKIKKPDLPIIASDPRLIKYFPHESVPHLVWINEKSKFYSATSGYNATMRNVQKLLGGEQVAFKQKEISQKVELNKPLIASADSTFFAEAIGYSCLLPGTKKFRQMTVIQKINGSEKENRVFLTRTSVVNLYKFAYNEGTRYCFDYANTLVLEVKDSSKFLRPKDESLIDSWEEENLFSYDLLVAASQSLRLYSIMQQDLDRYFHIKASVEKRKIPCLILSRISIEDKIATQGGKMYAGVNSFDTVWQLRNIPFKSFVERINRVLANKNLNTPLIDKTGYSGNIDISLSKKFFDKFIPIDLEALRNELMKYDLSLDVGIAEADVLVLREN